MEQQQDPLAQILSEFGTRLNEIEEKQRLIKDRTLLVGENLILTKEEMNKQESELKKQLKELTNEVNVLKQIISRLLGEIANFSRKSELEILERQFKMFEPLELVRLKDLDSIIEEHIKKHIPNTKEKASEDIKTKKDKN
ncbi:MAG: hypothetical protein ACP5OG_04765 [Candidatus Nanoarchaeia archaeon]